MTEKLRIAFGILGNITTILSSLAPIPTFYRIYKRKDTENFSVLPYATTISCNLFWACAVQVALQTVYLVVYFIYAPAERRTRTAILVAAILLLFTMDIVITMAFLKPGKRKTFAGVVATISSILAYAAPLSIMVPLSLVLVSPLCFFSSSRSLSQSWWPNLQGLVIRTRSVEYMPFLLSLAIFFSGFTWTVYGILGPDIFVIVSDGLGFLLSTLQLALYGRYYQPPPQQDYGSVKTLDLSEEMEEDSGARQSFTRPDESSSEQRPSTSSQAQVEALPARVLVPQAAKPVQFSQQSDVAML